MIGMRNFLTLLCSVLLFTAFTCSAPGTPNASPKPDSSALHEASHERSLPTEIDERAIFVGPPPTLVRTIVRYVACFYDLAGNIRILMPTFINQQLLGLTPGHINDIGQSLLINFLRDPFLNTLPNWHTVQARVWYPNPNIPLTNAVINLAIDFNALPVLQDDAPWLSVGGREMEDALLLFIRDLVTPYWQQSPSARLVAADPRGVNVDWMLVPDARSVGNTMSYVFQYLTPPGTPLDRTVESVQHNVTLAGNSTGIASKLKLATSSTVHLDANLTKRATDTCLDFYPNLLPFIQGGPITQVGTDSLACAS